MTVTFAESMTVTYADSTIIAQERAIPDILDGSGSIKYVLNGRSVSTYRMQNHIITGTTDSSGLTRKVIRVIANDEHELMGGDNLVEIDLAKKPTTFNCDERSATLTDLYITLRMTRL